MDDTVVGPVLMLGGKGAALLGAEVDASALVGHAALHPAADLDTAQLYDGTYRRLVPVRDGAGAVLTLRPVDGPDEPTDPTARRERVRAQLTRTVAQLRRELAVQLLHQQAAAARATVDQLSGGGKEPLVLAAVTSADELVEASRALLTAAGMPPVAPVTVADLSALLVDVAAADPQAGLDGAVAKILQRFASVAPGGASAGPPTDPNSGSPGHNLLHSLFGDFHREQPR